RRLREYSVAELAEDDVVHDQPIGGLGNLGRDAAGAQGSRVERAAHRVFRAEDSDPHVAPEGGLIGDDLRDVEPREVQAIARGFESHVSGVVRADEEVGARTREPGYALRKRLADTRVIRRLPRF